MIKVRFFGFIRSQIGTGYAEIDAGRIDEALKLICKEYRNIKLDTLKDSLIFVNSINIADLKRFKTVLKEGDEVMILSPVAGG